MVKLATVSLCLLAQSALAAEPPKNAVVADLGLHVVSIGFQRTVHQNVALQLTAGLYVPWTQGQNFLDLSGDADRGDVRGWVIRARAFVYPHGAPTGFWLSPFFQAGLATEPRGGETLSGTVYAGGASAGWAWLLFGHLHLQLGAGVQYHVARFPLGRGFQRFFPQLDINAGFAF